MADGIPLPVRKRHRLPIELYCLPGAYFITICTWHRQLLFGRILDGEMQLTPLGLLVQRCWAEIPLHFTAAELDLCVIMPNHFHAVVFIKPATKKSDRITSLPRIVQGFKANLTRRARNSPRPLAVVWQGSYWDHVIRDENELYEIRQYILANPLAWELDRENAQRTGLNPFYQWIDARRIPLAMQMQQSTPRR
jgi:putative transposase